MELAALLSAVINGSATGIASVATEALLTELKHLLHAYALCRNRTIPDNLKDYGDCKELASDMERLAEENAIFKEDLAAWQQEAESVLSGQNNAHRGSNIFKALFVKNSTINQSNS